MALVRTKKNNLVSVRKGRGYSLAELKEAKITLQQAKQKNIKLDYRRRTTHTENVKELGRA